MTSSDLRPLLCPWSFSLSSRPRQSMRVWVCVTSKRQSRVMPKKKFNLYFDIKIIAISGAAAPKLQAPRAVKDFRWKDKKFYASKRVCSSSVLFALRMPLATFVWLTRNWLSDTAKTMAKRGRKSAAAAAAAQSFPSQMMNLFLTRREKRNLSWWRHWMGAKDFGFQRKIKTWLRDSEFSFFVSEFASSRNLFLINYLAKCQYLVMKIAVKIYKY